MNYLVPFYCILTAITVVYAVIHFKFLFAFYVAASALLGVAAGDELRGVFKQGDVMNKIIRAITALIILVIAFWLGIHSVINLYYYAVPGTIWAILGFILGFCSDKGYVDVRVRRRRT